MTLLLVEGRGMAGALPEKGVSVSKPELSRLAFRLVQNVKNVTFIYVSYAQVEEYLQRMVSLPEKLYA